MNICICIRLPLYIDYSLYFLELFNMICLKILLRVPVYTHIAILASALQDETNRQIETNGQISNEINLRQQLLFITRCHKWPYGRGGQ